MSKKRPRSASDGRIQVSKHFYLHQFCHGREAPHPLQFQRIYQLALRLEEVIPKEGAVPFIMEIEGDYDGVRYCFLDGATYEHRGRDYRITL